MKRFLTTLAVLAFAGGALAGCGSKKSDNAATTTTAAASSGTTLTLVATNFQFDQTALSAKAGDTVTFVIKNAEAKGGTEHNLTIEGLKVNTDAPAGTTQKQTVTNLAAGTYQYHCEYHPTQMTGTLTVS